MIYLPSVRCYLTIRLSCFSAALRKQANVLQIPYGEHHKWGNSGWFLEADDSFQMMGNKDLYFSVPEMNSANNLSFKVDFFFPPS